MNQTRPWAWRRTHAQPFAYWAAGTATLWLWAMSAFIDLLLAPGWFAPNWQCDSLGIPILWMQRIALPAAIAASAVSAILTVIFARGIEPGQDVFLVRPQRWQWLITLLFGCMSLPFFYALAEYLYQIAIPTTQTSDCDGRAEMISLTARRPVVQLSPVCSVCVLLWLAHLHACALTKWSPKSA